MWRLFSEKTGINEDKPIEINGLSSDILLASIESEPRQSSFAGYLVPVFYDQSIVLFQGNWRRLYGGKTQQVDINLLGQNKYDLMFFPSDKLFRPFYLKIWVWESPIELGQDTALMVGDPVLLLDANSQRIGISIVNSGGGSIKLSSELDFSTIAGFVPPNCIWFKPDIGSRYVPRGPIYAMSDTEDLVQVTVSEF